MGTNFYFIPKISDEDKNEIITSIDNLKRVFEDNPALLKITADDLCYTIYEKVKKIHLGKRSGGWQFLWNHNRFKLYGPTIKSIRKYLENTEGQIVDEYGEKFTVEQFFNDEIGYYLYRNEDCMTAEDYHSKYQSLYYPCPTVQLEYKNKIYTSNKFGEFLIGRGKSVLRFASSDDFS